ncbi:MAG: hypothetical protein AB7G80_09515 [Dongiaceae bacterium]
MPPEAATAPSGQAGSAAAAEAKPAQPTIQPSHDESTPGDKGEVKPAGPERPEWLPENFWNKEKGEPLVEEMAKSWSDTRKKLSMRTDDLEKKVKEDFEKTRFAKRPEAPDKYELRLPEKVPAEAWEWNEKDPLLSYARNLAFETGMGQDDFDKLVGTYIESELSKLPDIEAETKRLGEKGKERLERVDQWLKANISRGGYAALSEISTKAEVVIAIEELMQKAGAPAFVVDGSGPTGQDVLTDAVVRSWMSDPKYWDPQRRDPKHIEKVDQAWKKLYPNKK